MKKAELTTNLWHNNYNDMCECLPGYDNQLAMLRAVGHDTIDIMSELYDSDMLLILNFINKLNKK